MENEVVFSKLLTLYHEQKLAHAYLIETNDIYKACDDIKDLIKKMCCQNVYKNECHECNLCNLIDNNTLPSLFILEPVDKTIKKDAVDELKLRFKNKSVITNNSFYIIISPEKMNNTAYNRMLKFLEEPEENIIGFFITNNKDNIVSTILSRLECIKVIYDKSDVSSINGFKSEVWNKYYELAMDFINNVENDNKSASFNYYKEILPNLTEKEDVVTFIKIIYTIYEQVFHGKMKTDVIKANNMLKKLNIVYKYLDELNYNVNTNLLFSSLIIDLGEANEKNI